MVGLNKLLSLRWNPHLLDLNYTRPIGENSLIKKKWTSLMQYIRLDPYSLIAAGT